MGDDFGSRCRDGVLVLPEMALSICCMTDTRNGAVMRGNTPDIDGRERDIHPFRGNVMLRLNRAATEDRMVF